MRVLHVIPAVAARYGGPSSVVTAVCRALADAGHDVTIATTDADGGGRLDVTSGVLQPWDGVPTLFFRRVGGDAFKWSPDLTTWLHKHARDFDVADVHAVFSHSSLAAGRACRGARVPYMVRPHGTLDPWSLTRKTWQKKAVLMFGGRQLLSRASLIQYTTDEEQRLARQTMSWLPEGVVVPLGVDDDCFSSQGRERNHQRPYVLAMSRLDKKKRLEKLIDAFHDVASRPGLDAWRLVIAGTGDDAYVEALRRTAANGPSAARIEFPGWVSGLEKRGLISGASLFASPSMQENFGISIVEAMAGGVPAFVSPGVNLSGQIEAAGAGWVVPDDSAMFRSTLTCAMSNPSELARRGESAKRFAGRFRWAASADVLAAAYRRITPHSGRGARG